MRDENGISVCSNATDDDGSFQLYNISTKGGSMCIGIDYSQYVATQIDGSEANAYDAACALIEGIIQYSKTNYGNSSGGYTIPRDISGAALAAFMTQNLNIHGVTGAIGFSQGIEELGYFGHGDRAKGVRYSVTSLFATNETDAGYHLKRVGTWMSEGGYVPCVNDSTLQSSLTGGCTALVWGSSDGMIPSDMDRPIDQIMPKAMSLVLYAFSAILFLCIFLVSWMLVKFRRSRLLRASQPPMLWLVLMSTVYAAARIIIAGGNGRGPWTCVVESWTGHLAFTGVMALFAKTLRVHLLVNSDMKKVTVSTGKVVTFTIILMGILVLYMCAVTPLGVFKSVTVRVLSSPGQITVKHSCSASFTPLKILLFCYESLIMLGALKVTFCSLFCSLF